MAPELDFSVESAEPVPFSVAPLIIFKLKIQQPGARSTIHAIALRCQIRIEPARRQYSDVQKGRMREIFGPPSQWGQTLRPMLWTHASTVVPSFTGDTLAELPVPCTYDFNIATTKYFDALDSDGEIPVCLLFSGTVFYEATDGHLQTAPISWEKEASYRLPIRIWRQMMDQHYPNSAWLCAHKDLFDRLQDFKTQRGYASPDQALDALLQEAGEKVAR